MTTPGVSADLAGSCATTASAWASESLSSLLPDDRRSRGSQQPAGHGRTRARRNPDYLTSYDFAVDVTENWQSEYLQFFLYIFATVWLLQRGIKGNEQGRSRVGQGPGDG
ncbi:DUF6766 family protein [Streptomyces clavifer]|uniref:DUF6766 family protein n=1 Tax=Streptomyces clavifer TaxID=68188 RepID=UPI003787A9A5